MADAEVKIRDWYWASCQYIPDCVDYGTSFKFHRSSRAIIGDTWDLSSEPLRLS